MYINIWYIYCLCTYSQHVPQSRSENLFAIPSAQPSCCSAVIRRWRDSELARSAGSESFQFKRFLWAAFQITAHVYRTHHLRDALRNHNNITQIMENSIYNKSHFSIFSFFCKCFLYCWCVLYYECLFLVRLSDSVSFSVYMNIF